MKIAYELEAMEDITAQQKVRAKILLCQTKCGSCFAGTPESAESSILLLTSALEIAKTNHLSYYEAIVVMNMVNCQVNTFRDYTELYSS